MRETRRQDSVASHSQKLGSTLSSASSPAAVAHAASASKIQSWGLRSTIPTDVFVDVGGTMFSLHKFPLASRSGRIRRIVMESRDYLPLIKLLVPGGPKAFELVANFCYGISFEITTTNVAALSCAAHYLEMTDEYCEGNLISQTSTFLNKVILDFSNAIAILHSCESMIPMAEELGIVSRCINAVASMACSYSVSGNCGWIHKAEHWWIEALTVLRVGYFQRMVAAMTYRGLTNEDGGKAVMLYAQCHLNGLGVTQVGLSRREQHKQKALLETIVDMLPYNKYAVATRFLFGLLRLAMTLDASLKSRLEIEQRIGMQLEEATLDDLSFLSMRGMEFDVDVVYRLAKKFFKHTRDEDPLTSYEFNDSSSIKVANLLENYLVEISDDPRLEFQKFNALAQVVPEEARVVSDSLYRAIDTYLKVHPSLAESARKEICKVMDVRKLSQEARLHAAQNERLPIQVVLQVLHIEQLCLKAGLHASRVDRNRIKPMYDNAAEPSERETYAKLRRENTQLKLEVARQKTRPTNLEKKHEDCTKLRNRERHGLLRSFSKSISKWNPFGSKQLAPRRSDESCINGSSRRHSIT